jgi:hypothetical protein
MYKSSYEEFISKKSSRILGVSRGSLTSPSATPNNIKEMVKLPGLMSGANCQSVGADYQAATAIVRQQKLSKIGKNTPL